MIASVSVCFKISRIKKKTCEKDTCEKCGSIVSHKHLTRHKTSIKCEFHSSTNIKFPKEKTNCVFFPFIILVRIQHIMRNMQKKEGGFLASMLAGYAGKQALSYLAPKVASWVASKNTGKQGKSLRLVSGKGVRSLGNGIRPHGGAGMTLLGKKGKKCAKCWSGNRIINKLVSAAKTVGKRELKTHVNYTIDNPMQSYNNVKKLVMGAGYTKAKKAKTLNVKRQSFPKQKVGIDSYQQGRTTAVTLSRVFKPGHEAVFKTIKQIKNKLYK